MSKTKNPTEAKLSSAKEQAIEKLFGASVPAEQKVAAKTVKKVVTKNQAKPVKMATKTAEVKVSKKTNSFRGKIKFDFKKTFQKIPKVALKIVGVLLLAVVAFLVYRYRLKAGINESMNAQAVEKRISVFMDLPTDEDPVFATVSDVEKINSQKFFAKAQNGDKVLVYTKNRKAILYRWSTNKLIEVSNLANSGGFENAPTAAKSTDTTQDTSTTPTASTNNTAKAKVAVLNGAKIAGLAKKLADSIATLPGVEIGTTANSKGTYQKSLVIDLSGSHSDLAAQIAQTVGGAVGQLPDGEIKPDADLLVIGCKQ